MSKLIEILKGIAIGVSNIIAGLSGGTVAVFLKIYERLIDACSEVLKHPIKVLKDLHLIIVGIIIGLVAGSFVLKSLITYAPLPTSLFFCGLVISGIPFLINPIRRVKVNYKQYLIFFLASLVTIVIPLLTGGAQKDLCVDAGSFVIVFSLGIISAASMVIPGISGSMVLASVGYYESLLGIITRFLKNAAIFNFSEMGSDFILLLFFGIGCLIGIVGIANIIKIAFKKYFVNMYYAILGLVSASSIAILSVVLKSENFFNSSKDLLMWLAGVVTLLGGLFLGTSLGKIQKKYQINYEKEALKYKDSIIEETCNILKFRTILEKFDPTSDAPFGLENKKALEYMLSLAKKDGFITKNIKNYAGHIEYGNPDGELLGVLAHLDVVPVSDKWDSNPFLPEIRDGKIFARGALDDKGPLMAAYFALKMIKDLNLPVKKRVRLIMGCDEESGSRCLEEYFKHEEMPNMGFSPDADFPLIYGEKGLVNFDITGSLEDSIILDFESGVRYNVVPDKAVMTLSKDLKKEYIEFLKQHGYEGEIDAEYYIAYGVSAHAMHPQRGKNASFILVDFLQKYAPCRFSNYMHEYLTFDPFAEKLGLKCYDKHLLELTMNVGIIKAKDNAFSIGVNCRLPMDNLEELFKQKLSKSVEKYGFKFVLSPFTKIHFVNPNSNLVTTLMESYQEITHDYDSKPFTIGGGTYAKFIENAVAFGPMMVGREDVVHQDNEYIIIDDLMTAVSIYAKAIYELIK